MADVTVTETYINEDYFDEKLTPLYVFSSAGGSVAPESQLSMYNGVDNRILTAESENEIQAEENLTFDGTNLDLTGDLIISGTINFGDSLTYIHEDSAGNLVFGDASNYPLELGEIVAGLNSWGSDNQIPYMNSGGDDFDYSANFNFDGADTLSFGGSQSTSDLRFITSASYDWWIEADTNSSLTFGYYTSTYLTLTSAGLEIAGDLFLNGGINFNDSLTYIREDSAGNLVFGDANTGPWELNELAEALGAGYIDASGTPSDNEIAIFTDANTVEGDGNLTWDGSILGVTGDVVLSGSLNFNDSLTYISEDSAGNLIFNDASVGYPVELGELLTGNETITLSGDVSGSGETSIEVTITANAVEGSMLNNNVISGQTEFTITDWLIGTDELLISDGGVIKRMDLDLLISNQNAILSAGLAGTDEFLISDAGSIKRMDVSVLETYMNNNLSFLTGNETITLSGDVTGSGETAITTTIANDAVESGMLNDNVISGQTALESGLAGTDELLVSDGGTIKRMDLNVLIAGQGSVITGGLVGTDEILVSDGGLIKRMDLDVLIAGQNTALSSGLASTDELLISDAGTIKRMDVGVIESYMQSNLAFNDYTHPNHTGHVTSAGDGATTLTVSAITGQTELASGLASTDELLVSDAGTIKRMDVSVIESYMQSNLSFLTGNETITLSGDVSGSGETTITVTIANDAVESGMLHDNVISGQAELASGLASTDELLVSDAGVVKRMDVSVLETYMQNNLTFGEGSVDTSGTPANDQIAIFTDADTIEGDSNLTWDGSVVTVTGNVEANRYNVDGSSIYIDSSAGDMTFTDTNTGTKTLAQLSASGEGAVNPINSTSCTYNSTTNINIGTTSDEYFVIHFKAERDMENSAGGSRQSGTILVLYNDETDDLFYNTNYIGEDLGVSYSADLSGSTIRLNVIVDNSNSNNLTFEGYIVTQAGAQVAGSGVTFGTDNQVPYTNAAGDDFDYSASLTFDGSELNVNGDIILTGSINFTDSVVQIREDSAGNLIFEDGSGGPYELSELAAGGGDGGDVYADSYTEDDLAVWSSTSKHLDDTGGNLTWDGSTLDVNGTITIDTINEHTGASGVTVEGSLLKDSIITTTEVQAEDGELGDINGKNLTLSGGDPYNSSGADGGDVIVQAGDARPGDGDSTQGDIHLIPGLNQAESTRYLYLGNTTENTSYYQIQLQSTQTNASIYMYSKGSGGIYLDAYTSTGSVRVHGLKVEQNGGSSNIELTRSNANVEVVTVDAGAANASGGSFAAGDLVLKSGDGYDDTGIKDGGDVFIYGGAGAGTGSRGNVYIGDGSASAYLPTRSSETSLISYNTTTGKLSYTDDLTWDGDTLTIAADKAPADSYIYMHNSNTGSYPFTIHADGTTRWRFNRYTTVFMDFDPSDGSVLMPNLNNVNQSDAVEYNTSTGELTYYTQSSDIRLKENLTRIEKPMDALMNINGYTFNFNELAQKDFGAKDYRQVGVIAQDVEQFFPEVVRKYREWEYKEGAGLGPARKVEYDQLVPILLEGLKQTYSEMDVLKKEIKRLKTIIS